MKTVMWSRVHDNGLEYCEIHLDPVLMLKGQVVMLLDGKPTSVTYQVTCDKDGATQSVDVDCRTDAHQQRLSIHRTIDNRWYANGVELTEFSGLKDIDLGITPSTNTLPIRRCNLTPGETQELTAVWVRFPELSLAPLRQRYTCTDPTTYLYESVQSGYQAKVMIDEQGVVTDYQSEWKRLV